MSGQNDFEKISCRAIFKTQWLKSDTNEDFVKFVIAQYVGKTGVPGMIRTCDPQYHIDDPSCCVHCFVPLELYLTTKMSLAPVLVLPSRSP